jgi:hypothetical protein
MTASKIGESLEIYQEYFANSVDKQLRARISDSGPSKTIAGFFIKNLVKLGNLVPGIVY